MIQKNEAVRKAFNKALLSIHTLKSYLSGWTLNLGVVPLLLFSAFLFFPALDFLRFLLFSVTRVLETMSLLLNQQVQHGPFAFCKPKVLSLNGRSVKAILCCIITLPVCSATMATKAEIINLGVGEYYELSLPRMTRFTIAQNDVVSHKERPEQKTLLVKGLKPGKAQILVWTGHGVTDTYDLFVLDSPREIKLQQLYKKLSIPGLSVQLDSHFLKLEGEISELKHYLYLKEIIDRNLNFIDNQLNVSEELSSHIFASVYQRFFSEYVDHVSCEVDQFDLVCKYKKDQNISEEMSDELSKKFGVEFEELKNVEVMQNYRIRLKLVQMEQMDGRQINLGLSQLNTRLGDLFQTGISSVITNNELVLKENNIQLSSLAEPEAIVQSGQEVSLDIGSDIPYASSSLHGAAQTQWKFAGLKIKVKLVRRGNALRVSYSTSFTRPSQGQTISGNRESSTLMVPLNIPLQLFQVSFQTLGEQKQNIPILGSIPILGKIFSSTGSQANYKNITGVLQIEKYKL